MRTPALLVLGAIAAAGLLGCTPLYTNSAPLPLQVQAYQTREFEVDKTLAISSVMSVFQDLGYIIQGADKDVGFITATSPTREPRGFLGGQLSINGMITSTIQTRATAVLEEVRPGFTTVRLNFVVSSHKVSEKGFSSDSDDPITEPEPYQVAFEKISEAIFVRSQARAATAGPAPAQRAAVP